MAPRVPDESARLAALHGLGILDTAPERTFDELVQLVAQICQRPIALVSFIDRDRQWFKATHGVTIRQMPRELAFCNHTIAQLDLALPLQVCDATLDPRFKDSPLVLRGPMIRFYAGVALLTRQRLPIGTLCVVDRAPGELSAAQLAGLCVLGRSVMAHVEARLANCGARARESHAAVRPIDAETLLRRHEGKSAVVEQLLSKFQQQLGEQVESLRQELAGRDEASVVRLAQSIEDSASEVSAEPLRASAEELEAMILAHDFRAAEECLRHLEDEARECIDYLPTAAASLRRAPKQG